MELPRAKAVTMLYNQDWDKPQRDIFSTDSLIAWLETKDPQEEYIYASPGNCMLAQYFYAMGKYRFVSVNPTSVTLNDTKYPLPKGWDEIALGSPLKNNKFTFGHALKRAKSPYFSLMQRISKKIAELIFG